MKKKRLRVALIFIVFPLIMFSQHKEANGIRVFYLGGQSNMDGYGNNKDLPKSLDQEFENVFIFHGKPSVVNDSLAGFGKWEKLRPGHGVMFSFDGNKNIMSNWFGVELSFAKKMQALYPNEKIAIIKYSLGGTSIDSIQKVTSWAPDYNGDKDELGINQYDFFLKTMQNAYAISDIDGDGHPDRLIPSGIVWMQGESDALHTNEIALQYYKNLKQLMDLIRAALHNDDLPVVIGKISDSGMNEEGKMWQFGELIQYAQEKYARIDRKASIVRDTKDYGYSDGAHYNSSGYISLGESFANLIYELNKE
ncbi:sialate O-acetylesterase [Flavivirga spongiicola]|uniref:Sialate O-acetylesterase n=1 Tax=Flavivirga spongiicola TaxID=421621 RepID=A0ABU7XQQ8_9FLAO|nr:sialate O-acetylesterase [Flavivirga sp. MEBiC05379]MDO5977891.1 sialate O-acetylesterase [Flavivirga sp. MEBiC05379]